MWTLHKLKKGKRKRTDERLGLETGAETAATAREADVQALDPPVPPIDHPKTAFDDAKPWIVSPWDFSQEDLEMFPALRRRNFWCIQRHQARALHYDLRMQIDGCTMSWAIPRGLLGISKKGEKNRLAVETTLHPISYTTYEGGDGRVLPSGERCGTCAPVFVDVLWDVGNYTIDYPWIGDGSDSEDEKRRKRRRRGVGAVEEESEEDPFGKHEEDKFRMAIDRKPRVGKARSIHFTLHGGRKMTNHSYILIQSPQNGFSSSFGKTGKQKINWFISLPKGVEGYSWGSGGEEGEEYGRSVKTGRTLREVCAAQEMIKTFANERERFADWAGDVFELKPERNGADGVEITGKGKGKA